MSDTPAIKSPHQPFSTGGLGGISAQSARPIQQGRSRAPLLPPGTLELLAPARDLECARAAIDCGADAVYMGAPRFGAREAAGNTLDDVAAAAAYAHRYWARLYLTINTLLTDRELTEAEQLAWQLADAGADALIIQDVGLLESKLPPLPLVASTQMHNHTPERVAFLEQVGFHRAILARELDTESIRRIHESAPNIELEFFVHGALCVSYSGQCALSYVLGGRSGNRGQCAQPCRKPYRLVDAHDQPIADRGHWLCIRDLNLSECLSDLIDAGVTSFKIEGRLKDRTYVANTVAHYRHALDEIMAPRGLRRSTSGRSSAGFVPDPAKTFNRGFTTYFLHGTTGKIGATISPKMLGEKLGTVRQIRGDRITMARRAQIQAGDGLCFLARGSVQGTQVNGTDRECIVVQNPSGIRAGTVLYRNHDHAFFCAVTHARTERRIAVEFLLHTSTSGVALSARDEDGVEVTRELIGTFEPARQSGALDSVRKQLAKTGGTPYLCTRVDIDAPAVPFLPVSVLNGLRRDVLDALTTAREQHRPRPTGGAHPGSCVPYPERELSYFGNVLNSRAEIFYRRHGVTRIEPAAESGLGMRGKQVMTTRYCVKHELDQCDNGAGPNEAWFLIDDEGNRLRLAFDCDRCGMDIFVE